jgi:serine/threonine-protein kinase
MSLAVGTRLGAYEITGALGTGGMGEVYRARDTRLDRDVAIKVLPAAVAADPERIARFEREAKTLAALNHPNIAQIHGVEESDPVRALVMEFVDGDTLADRIAGGPIPLHDALLIARQIADALDAAHENGIVHRDLKPANVKVRPDETVKVLDFGLAKALEPISGVRPSLADSPTITSPAMTQMGVLLGTAAYMAPEQARGRLVDKRADVWAFGTVLFEMLSGRPPFPGDDISHVLARVIDREPDWPALPAETPQPLRRLLMRCLKKDPKERLRDIGDARAEITELLNGAPESAVGAAAPSLPAEPVWRRMLPWAVAGVLTVALALALWQLWRRAPSSAPLLVEIALGADASLVNSQASLAITPDGMTIAFAAQDNHAVQQLYLRHLGELRAAALPGTVNGRDPFFSPDGQWVGFFAEGNLKRTAVTGGAPVTIAAAPDGRGGAWADDGSIVFQPNRNGSGLSRVSSDGGTPTPVTTLVGADITHRWPQVLPGANAVLYTAHSNISGFDDATIVVQRIPDGAPTVVQRGGYYGRYLRSGHLVYVRQGTLFAEPFDLARLKPTGPPVPTIEGISTYTGGANTGATAGSAVAAWSGTGMAVYRPAQGAGAAPIQWMDRTGTVKTLYVTSLNWASPQFSPDGQQLAMDSGDGRSADVFVYDLARNTLTRLTLDAAPNTRPIWTPDSHRIVYRSSREGSVGSLYWQRVDGGGSAQRLTNTPNVQQTPTSWHPGGKFLAFTETHAETANDIMVLPMEGDEASGWKPGTPTPFLASPAAEGYAMFSPDGKWIAYQSNESGSGRFEVYVRPFPGPGGRWQISTEGGGLPVWSRTRHELFYAAPDNRLMVVPYVIDGDAFKNERPRVWSERPFLNRPGLGSAFALDPDGDRFALAAASETAGATPDKLVLVSDFFEKLRRLAPSKKQ